MPAEERSSGYVGILLAILATLVLPGTLARQFGGSSGDGKSPLSAAESRPSESRSKATKEASAKADSGEPTALKAAMAFSHGAGKLLCELTGKTGTSCHHPVIAPVVVVAAGPWAPILPIAPVFPIALDLPVAPIWPGPLRALFVTVPEPSWGLDGTLEAIERAFEMSGYSLRAQDLHPFSSNDAVIDFGVLVYTKQEPREPSRPARQSAFVVYLIEETPSTGIRLAALGTAVEDWDSLPRQKEAAEQSSKETLALLAPAFSGSAPGLAQYVSTNQRLRSHPLEMISGRATDGDIAEVLRSVGTPERSIRFHTTVRSDAEMQQAMYHYLIADQHAECRKIALIVESSTPYGNATVHHTGQRRLLRELRERAHPKRAVRRDMGFCQPRLLPVPFDLRVLRAEWARKKNIPGSPAGNPYEDLQKNTLDRQLDDAKQSGRLPLFSKETLNARDLSLSTLLSTLYQEGIRYVGLMVTDAGDKMFLAQRISANCPDAQLFTFESELLLIHPADLPNTRGMLVASTYPLFTRNQQWTYPYRGAQQRLQFASQADQGVYNAALLLLGHPEYLLEYAPPWVPLEKADNLLAAKPPVWISAVGRNALVPVHVVRPEQIQTPDAAQPAKALIDDTLATRRDAGLALGSKPPTQRAEPPVPNAAQRYSSYDLGTVRVLILLLSLLALLLAHTYRRNSFGAPLWVSQEGEESRFFDFLKYLPPSPHPLFANEYLRRELYVLWLTVPLMFLEFYLGLIVALRFRTGNTAHEEGGAFTHWLMRFFGNPSIARGEGSTYLLLLDRDKIIDLLFTLISTVGLSLMGIVTICALASLLLHRARWQRLFRMLFHPTTMAAGGAVLALAWLSLEVDVVSALDPMNTEQWYGIYAILFLRRSAQTSYELSPLLPLLLLSAMSLLWGYFNLRRLSLLSHRELLDFPVTAPKKESAKIQQYLSRCYRQLGSYHWGAFALVLVALLLVASPVFWRLSTIDIYRFHQVFRLLFCLATALILMAVARLFLTWRYLDGALHHLLHHPVYSALDRLPRAWRRPLGTLLVEDLSGDTEQQMLQSKLAALAQALLCGNPGARRTALPDHLAGALSTIEEWLHRWQQQSATETPLPLADRELEAALCSILYGAPTTNSLAWLTLAEDVLATRVLLSLTRLMPHLRNSMLLGTMCMVLMLAALSSYPFQPMQWMMMLIWLIFLSVCGLTALVLAQLNRSPVLSILTGSEPGKLSWDLTFMRPIAIYILVPLGSLFSTQLPEFTWLVKLLQNLK